MKIIHHVFILIVGVYLLYSCLPNPLEVESIPIPDDQVVIGTQIIPDQFLVMSLTKNFTALEAGPDSDVDSLLNAILMSDIEVQVTIEGNAYPINEISPGIYGGTNLPQTPGATYTLSFENPFNNSLTIAETTLLPPIQFAEVRPILNYTPFDTLLTVTFSLQDPEGPNWYMLNAQKVGQDIDLTERPFTELLSDEDFDGELYEGSFEVFFRDFSPRDTVLISLANISEGYYDFLELRNNQLFLFLDGIGEPVNYQSNVQNGLGFFNLHIPDIRFFDLRNL